MKRLLWSVLFIASCVTVFAEQGFIYRDVTLIEKSFSNSSRLELPAGAYDIQYSPSDIVAFRTAMTNTYPENMADTLALYVKLTNSKAELESSLQKIAEEKKRTQTRIALLDKIMVSLSGNTSAKFSDTLDRYLALEQTAMEELDALAAREKKALEDQKELLVKIRETEAVLAAFNIPKVICFFDTPVTGSVSYKLRASWNPLYTVNLDRGTLSMDIGLNAQTRVSLSLEKSSVFSFFWQPSMMDVNLPRLSLVVNPPMAFGGMPRPSVAAKARSMESARDEADPEMLMNSQVLQEAHEDTTTTGVVWNISRPVRFENGGKLPIATDMKIDLRQTYWALPSKSAWGQTVLEISNTTEIYLLPGSVRLLSKGQEVPDLNIGIPVAPNSAFSFPGIETRNIQCERRIIRDFTERPTLLRSTAIQKKEIEIRLKNNFARDIELNLRDRLPIPSDSRITVREIRVTDKTEAEVKQSIVSNSGILEWKLPMKPGETRTIRMQYNIEYPGDATISERESR